VVGAVSIPWVSRRSLYVFTRQFCPSKVDGVGSRSWLGGEKKIRWEDIASLRYNTGNKQFTVCANDGRKITHSGFNAEPGLFQHEIQKRTRFAVKVTRPGTWKAETFEVPYEEVETEQEVTHNAL
jgi:hypothetical protein